MRTDPRRLALLLALAGCTSTQGDAPPATEDLGHGIEGLGPGIVSTAAIEDSVAFLPDGTLIVSRRAGRWGTPSDEPCRLHVHRSEAEGYRADGVLFPSLPYADDPFVSPDGSRLVFVSRSPDAHHDDRDLWIADRTGDGWGEPRPLPAPINTPFVEMGPSLDRAGNLLFASDRPGGPGSGDLWLARFDGTRYRAPEPLPAPVNAATGEWNGLLAPDGSFVVFEASERATNVTPFGDLYVAWQLGEGSWSAPEPLKELNGPGSELNARVTPDGLWLAFASSTLGAGGNPSLFRVPIELLERYRPGRD